MAKWTPIGGFEAVPQPLLTNGGFADNAADFAVERATGYISQCRPIVGWTASNPGHVGLQPLLGGLRNMGPTQVPADTHFAFLQYGGTTLRQTLDGLKPGQRYRLTWQAAARAYADATSPREQVLTVSVTAADGKSLANHRLVLGVDAFVAGELAFVPTSGSATVTFANGSEVGESTVCVTGVAVE
ncbi:MAG: DUF642 domain-containing protein [Armatimonadetes bacterium]|nr:DUF642 domain-containing protein [Armatimonadota bacterium]